MPRGAPKTCTSCARTHWSIDQETCPTCRKVPPSRRHDYGPRQRVLDHDLKASPSVIRGGSGRCLGLALHDMPSEGEKRCRTHWRRLSHRHCPTVGCGRAMGVDVSQCGACTALELFEPQSRELREIMQPETTTTDPFPGIDHYTDRAREEYHADMLGLPFAVAFAI